MQGLIQPLSSRLLWLGIAMLAALAFGVDILARLFWFEALGYDAVFWRILLLKAGSVRRSWLGHLLLRAAEPRHPEPQDRPNPGAARLGGCAVDAR